MAAYIPHCLQVGSMVEVWKNNSKGPPRYGVIRWIGNVPQMTDKMVAGVEMVSRIVASHIATSPQVTLPQSK